MAPTPCSWPCATIWPTQSLPAAAGSSTAFGPGLEQNGFSYLLAIRLLPAFPFWLVNLAAGLSGMRLLPYAAATVIGIMPATFVYASIGSGIGEVLATGGTPNLAVIFAPHILGPLIALAALSLLPVAWRHWKRSDA